MSTLKCLVIDDEELARTLLNTYIDKIETLELVGSFDSPLKAMPLLTEGNIDVIFLDIQIPELKGTEFAKLVSDKIQVVFTTAYSEYALEGFELNAIDYLLKPITFERFLKATTKLKIETQNITTEADTIIVKSGYDLHKIKHEDINYVISDSEYVVFHTTSQKIMSHKSLSALEKELPASKIMRVHRSFIINKSKVTSLKGKELLIQDAKIPVSTTYFEKVKSELF
jgi:DNA-binding LytR/AlgR family response regulator